MELDRQLTEYNWQGSALSGDPHLFQGVDPLQASGQSLSAELVSAVVDPEPASEGHQGEVISQLHSSQGPAMSETPTAAETGVFPDTFAASLAALDQQARRLRAMQAAELQRGGQLPAASPAAAAASPPSAPGGAGAQPTEAADTSDGSLSDAEGSSGSPHSAPDAQQEGKRSCQAAAGLAAAPQPPGSRLEGSAVHKRPADVLPQDIVLDDESGRQLSPKEFRRLRRRITNRESAHRMRAKRQEELETVQREAAALGQENGQLKGYIGRLEREQRSLAMDLVSWQTRWKTTAASNVKLYHQLLSLHHHKSEQQHHTATQSHLPAVHRLSTAPSAPAAVLQHLSQLGSTPLARSTSDCSSMQNPQVDSADMQRHVPGYRFDARAPAYADQLDTAMDTIFGARDAALESHDVLGSGDMPSPQSNLSGVRRWS